MSLGGWHGVKKVEELSSYFSEDLFVCSVVVLKILICSVLSISRQNLDYLLLIYMISYFLKEQLNQCKLNVVL